MNQLPSQLKIITQLNDIINDATDQFTIDKYTDLKRIYLQYQDEMVKFNERWGN